MGGLSHTVSGDIASFRTPSRVPIENLKFHFLPKQADETPSPENPIPIEGWTGLSGKRANKNIGHIIGYSAVSMNTPTAAKKTTNTYGTTINTTDFISPDTSLIISQEQTSSWAPETPQSYKNGYFCIGFDNLIFDKYYDFSFKITNVLSNPFNLEISSIKLNSPGGGQKSCTEVKNNNILIFRNIKWERHSIDPSASSHNRCTLEFRNCGMSFTISEIMVTPANKSDGIFESYQGEIIPVTFPIIGKNKCPLTATNTIESINTNYVNTLTRSLTPGTIYQGVSGNNYWLGQSNRNFISNIGPGTMTYQATGGGYGHGICIEVIPSTTYTVSYTENAAVMLRIGQYKITGEWTKLHGILGNNSSFTTGSETRYIILVISSANGYADQDITISNLQLELGNTATVYETYSPNNLVYGGYYDPIAGELVAEYKTHIWTGTETNFGMNFRTSDRFYALITDQECQYGNNGSVKSNMLKTQYNHGANTCYQRPSDAGYLMDFARTTICNLSLEDYDALTNTQQSQLARTYLAELYANETPLVTCFKLMNPVHIPVAPQNLKAFLDHNNFWSNTNDITEVTYAVTESKDILATRKKAMAFDHAHHKKVKWNQLIVDGQFTDASKWTTNVNYGSVSVNNNVGTWTCTVTPDYYYRTGIMESREHLNIPETHKILMRATVRSSVAIRIALYALALGYEHSNPYYQDITINEWTTIFGFVVQRNAGKFFAKGKICYGASSQNVGNIVPGTTLEAKDFMMFDLTQMFGLGNEPSTVAEFERICALNGIDLTTYQPYDEGSDRWLIIP